MGYFDDNRAQAIERCRLSRDDIAHQAKRLIEKYPRLVDKDSCRVDVEVIVEKELLSIGWQLIPEFDRPIIVADDDKIQRESIHKEVDRKIDKICGVADFRNQVVRIDERDRQIHPDAPYPQTRSLAYPHELFHAKNHTRFALLFGVEDWPNTFETQANLYARFVCLPAEPFRNVFQKECNKHRLLDPLGRVIETQRAMDLLTSEVVFDLAKTTKVSTKTVAIRAKDTQLMSYGFAENLISRVGSSLYSLSS